MGRTGGMGRSRLRDSGSGSGDDDCIDGSLEAFIRS